MQAEFDQYADEYEAQLAKGLKLTGESRLHFLRERLRWLHRRLRQRGLEHCTPEIMDFGCGTGVAGDFLLQQFGAEHVHGYDVSSASIAVASSTHTDSRLSFSVDPPNQRVTLVHASGVFHHIVPEHRQDALNLIRQALVPGGVLAFFENNPWNPLMRYSMSQVEFDRDAVMLSAPEAAALLKANGFEVLHVDFLFFFPAALRRLRFLEPSLTWLPLGAQYLVLAVAPD